MLRQALEMAVKTYGDQHVETATIRQNLGVLFYQQGKLKGAERLFKQALAARQALLGESDPSVANVKALLAKAIQAQGRVTESTALRETKH